MEYIVVRKGAKSKYFIKKAFLSNKLIKYWGYNI